MTPEWCSRAGLAVCLALQAFADRRYRHCADLSSRAERTASVVELRARFTQVFTVFKPEILGQYARILLSTLHGYRKIPMSIHTAKAASGTIPTLSLHTLMLMLISGSVATIAFDNWGQAISPWFGFANLAPVPLARGTLQTFFGIDSAPGAHFMHLFLVGLVAYPLGWMVVFRPLCERLFPGLHWLAASAIYGFGLWLLAIGLIASTVTGNVFLNWTGITYVALVGHVLYGIVCAATLVWLEAQGGSSSGQPGQRA